MSLNGQGPFSSRDYNLNRRYQQQSQQSGSSDKPADSGRNYDSGRTNPTVPDTTPTTPPGQTNQSTQSKSFFTSLDDLNQLIDQEQDKTSAEQNNPYSASLKQLEKLNNWLKKDVIPAVDDIQFEAFGQLDVNSPEGQDVNDKLNAFLIKLSNSGKAGKLRAEQIKTSVNVDLLNAQKSLLLNALNNAVQGAPEIPELQSRLNAIESLLQNNQGKLDKLNQKDPSKGTRVKEIVFKDNGGGSTLSATELYNRARQWAMKVLNNL